jgi:multidrug resistance efflux pump
MTEEKKMVKINLKSKKIRWFILATVILSIAAGGYYLTKAETVADTVVITGPVEEIIKDIGTLRSRAMVDLTAYGSGEVLSLEVEVGQRVDLGDVLATLDDKLLKYQLESLSNEVKAVEVDLNYLSSGYADLTVDSASNAARIARESYEKSKKDYETAKLLYEAGAISRSELDSSELIYNVDRMSYTIALNEADTTSGTKDTNLNQVSYQLKSLQAQLDRVQHEIESYIIRAPFDGVVSAVYVDVKDYAQMGTPIVQVYERDYYVEVNLLEDDLVLIDSEMPVRFIVNDEAIESGIIRIHPTIMKTISDLGVSQLKGTIDVESTENLKLVGRELDVEFIVKAKEEALLLDKDALFRYDGKYHVYKIVDGIAVLTPVTIGIKGNDYYEVVEGLAVDDLIILDPSEIIEDGMKVKN